VIVLADFFSRGGPVLYAVFAAALLLWAMISHRLWFFYGQRHVLVSDLEQRWLARTDRTSVQARQIRAAWISRFHAQASFGQPLIGVLIAVCPLLGLLGTVTGMIQVFDVLATTGTGNARAMADGIAQATLPTMAGLVIALSGLYFRSRFQRLAERSRQEIMDRLALVSGTVVCTNKLAEESM